MFRHARAAAVSLCAGNRSRSGDRAEIRSRRTHHAAQMSAIGSRTIPIYSMTVDVDDPTRAILSDHGIDAPYPTEFKLKFQVYKKVAVTAGLVTSAEEEAWVLSMHVALALLRDLPLLKSYDTSTYIDQEKTLAFHKEAEPREVPGIANEPGPQELSGSEDEGSDDAPDGPVRLPGVLARAEIKPGQLRVSSAKPTKIKVTKQAFRQWADACAPGWSARVRAEAGESADKVTPEPPPAVSTPKGRKPATPKAPKAQQGLTSLTDKDLLYVLAENDLTHFTPLLVKAGVTTVRALMKHSCDELFESLSRKHVCPHFKASSVEIKALVAIGLEAPATMTPPKPTWEQALAPVAPTAKGSFGASFGVPKPAAAKPAQRVSFFPASAPERPPCASEPIQVYALDPPSPLKRNVRIPMLAAVEQSPCVKALFARVGDSELKPETFWRLAEALNQPMAQAAKAIDDSPEDGVGVLELILADKVVNGMNEHELHMPDDGIRHVKNRVIAWSRPSLTAQAPPAYASQGREGEAPAQEASMASLAGLAAAAASGMGRQHDGKTGEETSASESRLQAAYEDAPVRNAIFDLQRVMLSEAKDAEKLAAFKREVERNAKLAPVLASAFHRRPQGAFAMMPRAIELEGAVRDVMSGARQAMRATAEALGTVPPHAEVDALLKAVQAGRLHGCSNGQHNLSLKVLADAGAKIDWLSQQAASSKPTGDAAAVAVGRQVAMTMPFLTMAYAALHPWDDSVRQTFDLVMAAMARGYGNSGVASAVKNVLLPFLRALEEQMDTFQKSASATLPKLAAVWAKVAAVAPTKAWLSSAESSFSTESNNSEKKELQVLKTEVQTALAALKKAQATPKTPVKPPGTQVKAPEGEKTAEEKKAAKKAKKARQAARKAAREAGEAVGADTADEAEDE